MRAARGQARYNGMSVDELSASNMLDILDDMSFAEPNIVASKWYAQATSAQLALFAKEWARFLERGY